MAIELPAGFPDHRPLWALAYVFLLCVPFETTPFVDGGSALVPGAQSPIRLTEDGKVGLRLVQRKSRPRGSTRSVLRPRLSLASHMLRKILVNWIVALARTSAILPHC